MRLHHLALSILTLFAPVLAQCPGKLETFGTGGPDCSLTPHTLTGAGCPTPGQSVELTATCGPAIRYPIAVFLGGSDKTWNGVPLPFDLTPFGAPSNHAYVSLDVQIAFIRHNGGGGKTALPIPADNALVGATVFAQSILVGCRQNSLLHVFSNGLKITIG